MEQIVRTLLALISAEQESAVVGLSCGNLHDDAGHENYSNDHNSNRDSTNSGKNDRKMIQAAAVMNGFTGGLISKKRLLPIYLKHTREFWGASEKVDAKMRQILQIKPRRTASGVATITVMTKPWTCLSACIYCPNDVRMPKSYLADEPVCQRALRVYFDPYLQVISRLRALKQMGHQTNKIELIILGGTFTDYPVEYQNWFIHELFRGLNDSDFSSKSVETTPYISGNEQMKDKYAPVIGNTPKAEAQVKARKAFYKQVGLLNVRNEIDEQMKTTQKMVLNQELTYNLAIRTLYLENDAWKAVAEFQKSTMDEIIKQQKLNEHSTHRVVGLVVETRPDTLNTKKMLHLRQLGCTKVQIGLQSLDEKVLKANHRNITLDEITNAFALLRLYGFKIHIHFMMNLYTSNPYKDLLDYEKLVTDPRFLPDEIKLYPCMLVDGTPLKSLYETGDWTPYSHDELVTLLAKCTKKTPRYARISRMIRDISAADILAGNKKSNLRQTVDIELNKEFENADTTNRICINEIRYREIGTKNINTSALQMRTHSYQTNYTTEYFIEWITEQDLIAGFLRLSIPTADILGVDKQNDPFSGSILDHAMIREVHIYGASVALNPQELSGASKTQHKGLGRKLIAEAENIARMHNRKFIRVISAVGTRDYYRKQGFSDSELYQIKELKVEPDE
ncbi:MAG: tRNA uridine(34) 5-carboxymethylaminomethyl modification radical SAM/GNAT enzyme Elp3 [Candidatus Ancillula sp.]|jgi:elongator complex protein 3|nr:tRNA uridine(34) 5-carboxymethylaminomethyl modification radical SAM/GNAT enzyme Elp3 [Candidatus Ancillula sp.]